MPSKSKSKSRRSALITLVLFDLIFNLLINLTLVSPLGQNHNFSDVIIVFSLRGRMGVGFWGVSRGVWGAQVRSGSYVGAARAPHQLGLSVGVARAQHRQGLCVKGARALHCSQGMRLRQDPRLGTGNEFNYEEVTKILNTTYTLHTRLRQSRVSTLVRLEPPGF